MYLTALNLFQFKNYAEAEFTFDGDIICITGKNGSGKTNLLDAIYFLCFTKSYFVHTEAMCVRNGCEGMRIQAVVHTDRDHILQCILRENGKKEFSVDSQLYAQLSAHIGKYPVVIITPDDTQLITEGSEGRRKFIDILISQLDAGYMRNLMRYNKILSQRNALLKNGNESGAGDPMMLDILDRQLSDFAQPVFEARKHYIEMLRHKTNEIYHQISDEKEDIEITYQSKLHEQTLLELLSQNRQKDILSQRSNYGIHKDDLVFTLHGMPLKTVASQGQRKSFLFGLKFAQFDILRTHSALCPVLLLDDIFEKLDEKRGQKLIAYISNCGAQVFITDTHKERLHHSFDRHTKKIQWIDL